MKKALVTGGAGFIGSFLCEKLIGDGFEVICLDSFITGSRKNLESLLNNKSFSLIEWDVKEPFDHEADYIFHLASPASPVDYYKYSIETLLVNSIGTYNCLQLASKNKARFLLASTSEVYGDPLEHPQKESYWGNVNPVGPRSCYDEAKRFAESLTVFYAKENSVEYVVLRIFNTFGPRMRTEDGRVVPNFISQALTGKPLTVFGDGSQKRSFCYIDDMVEGITKAMFEKKTSEEIINLGNTEEMTIVELANLIREMCGSDSKLKYFPLPEDDPKVRQPDIGKAKSLLGWEPKISPKEGLRKTIEWYRKEIKSIGK